MDEIVYTALYIVPLCPTLLHIQYYGCIFFQAHFLQH